jgi:hypothetical protein
MTCGHKEYCSTKSETNIAVFDVNHLISKGAEKFQIVNIFFFFL